MQAQLVSLEDSKLMKIITLDQDIWKKIWFSSVNHIFEKNCETNYMFQTFAPIEYFEFRMFEKKNLEKLKAHFELKDIKYELLNGRLNDEMDTDNRVNIIERPNDFYLLQSKSGCKLITFKYSPMHDESEVRILHLGNELCRIEYERNKFHRNQTVEKIVKKNTRKHKTIDRQTSWLIRVEFNKKKVEKIKEDLEKAEIEFHELYEI